MADNSPRVRLVILLLSSVCLTNCGLKERARSFLQGEEHDTAAITIGGRSYSTADLERFFDSRLSEFRDPSNGDKIKSNLLESFIDERLLLYRAEQKNVQPNEQALKVMMERISPETAGGQEGRTDPARRAELERSVRESLMMQEYLNDYLIRNLTVSDEECESYYKEHLGEYVKNDVVRVREILVDDLSLAEKIRGMLKAKANKNFEDLARVYSKAPSAADGGDLGLFEKGDLPEEFEQAVFTLSPGSVSKIVPTRYGYHIFLAEEKIVAHQQRLVEVKDQIKEKLRVEREREIINRELESLRKEIPVEIHREVLGFNYTGTRYGSPEGTIR
jgi:peptidyl-prolyl cis-trans isomerase C